MYPTHYQIHSNDYHMRKSYYRAPLLGLYFYILFQIIFLLRFGRINTQVHILDLGLVIIGISSVLLYTFFANKLTQHKHLLIIPFLLALSFSYLGTLGGGLIHPLALLVFGLIPFGIAISAGYFIIVYFTNKKPFPRKTQT